MEIIEYVSMSDWFTHYIINNAFGVPFELRVLIIGAWISFIYLVLKKLIW